LRRKSAEETEVEITGPYSSATSIKALVDDIVDSQPTHSRLQVSVPESVEQKLGFDMSLMSF